MKSKTTILMGILVVTFAAALLARFGMQFLGERREHMSTGKDSGGGGNEIASAANKAATSLSNTIKSLKSPSSKKPFANKSASMHMGGGKEGFTSQSVPMPADGSEVASYGDASSSTNKPVSLKPYENADDNKLFQYQDSEFTPQCCPSSITNDVGCLCPTTKEKKDWLTRGGNRIGPDADIQV